MLFLREWWIKPWAPEWLRPWKLFTLAIGIALLLIGSHYQPAPDWDYPVSFIMAIATYLTAPFTLNALLCRLWRQLPLAIFFTWLSVDGFYWVYWSLVNSEALFMREANAPASTSLYLICGVIWLYRGSLNQLWRDMRAALAGSKHND